MALCYSERPRHASSLCLHCAYEEMGLTGNVKIVPLQVYYCLDSISKENWDYI
jgi:hypothetical protein